MRIMQRRVRNQQLDKVNLIIKEIIALLTTYINTKPENTFQIR